MGRPLRVARRTQLHDTPANRHVLEPLAEAVGEVLRAGKDPLPVLDALLEKIGTGIPSLTDTTAPTVPVGPTVASYFRDWFAYQEPLIRRAQARDYRRHLEGYVLPRLGTLGLAELNPSDIRGLQAELLGRELSTKYVKNIIGGSFRALVRQALEDELLAKDSFPRLKWRPWHPPEPQPFDAKDRTRIVEWFRTKRFGFHPGSKPETSPAMHPHPPFHVYVHLLFWTGLRPSEASGLQWQDVDLERGVFHVRRSRHLYEYGDPKTHGAWRTVELFPETVRLLATIQPLRVEPELPVFVSTTGEPIEPKAFASRYWYRCLRGLGIRTRGIYCTKDTFVTTALQAGTRIAWLENQTGVSCATLRRHYGKWLPREGASELRRFAKLAPVLFQ